eukprot:Blabericola_migrator_1__12126@NODE_748_length_6661_cov_222_679102_g536_i0_p3_GENE_NODE_748_length_6661_cov_222_679102_g536_i0NODE_748_length_6661_cov_222_679102_g536_i0_p3_ORF_typecomplete_len440_score47_48_NODE_748_length_6661_cov_222_679102_g536_i01321451
MVALSGNIVCGQIDPTILDFLSPGKLCQLLTICKEVRSYLLSPQMEFRHMHECMILTSARWVPKSHSHTCGLDETPPTTWLQFLAMLHQEMRCHSSARELIYEDWRWKKRQDPILDRLTYQWRCLCPNVAERPHIEDLAVYDMVQGDVMSLAKAAPSIDLNRFVLAVIPELAEVSTKKGFISKLTALSAKKRLNKYMRLVRVRNAFQPVLPFHAQKEEEVAALNFKPYKGFCDGLFKDEEGTFYDEVALRHLSPFVARAILAQEDCAERMIGVKPAYFFYALHELLPWDPTTHYLMTFNMWNLLKTHSDVFSLAPKRFWDLSIPLKASSDADVEQWLQDDMVLCNGLRALQRLETQIIREVKAHMLVQTKDLLDIRRIQLPRTVPQDNQGELGVLEISLTDAITGPNPRVSINDRQGDVCILYLGPQSLYLYRRHNEHK